MARARRTIGRTRRARVITGALTVLLVAAVLVTLPRREAAADAANLYTNDNVQSMTRVGNSVYWSSYTGCPGGEFPVTCRIRSANADDVRWSRLVFSNSAADAADDIVSNITSSGYTLFWADAGGEIVRSPYSQLPSGIAVKENPAAVTETAADATHVYWTENDEDTGGKLFRTPHDGGPRQLVYINEQSAIEHLRVDDAGGLLFVTSIFAAFPLHRILIRLTPSDTGFVSDTADFVGVESFTSDDDSVYFIRTLGAGSPDVRRAPLADLSADVRLAGLDGAGSPRWPAMAVNELGLYWHEHRPLGGPIVQLRFGSGSPTPITGALTRARSLAADETHLFVHAGESIYRYPADAAPRTLDLVGNEQPLEVMQVLQNAAHDVPLIAQKRTFVRTYGRIAESSADLGSLQLWPSAVLHGTRICDGTIEPCTPGQLPGSPLTPVEPKSLRTDATPRLDPRSGFLFELPESWTTGTVRLRSSVNDSRRELETRYDNNTSERTVTFQPVGGICLDMLPVLTTAGVSHAGVDSEVLAHFARAKSVYPTHRFAGVFRGGTPRTIPLVNDPYNMRDGDHKNMLMLNLAVEFMFSGAPSHCGDMRTIRTAYVPDASNFGMSSGAAPIIWALAASGGPTINAPVGAMKGLAHEVGHQFGISHIFCPMSPPEDAPDGPYETYPYPACQIEDDNDHLGFDVISRRVILPLTDESAPAVADFMTYSEPNWVSDHSYKKIYRQLLAGAPAATAVEGSGATTGDPSTTAVASVVGGILPATGVSTIGVAYQSLGGDVETIRQKIGATSEVRADYEVRTFDAAGALLRTEPLRATTLQANHDQGTLLFFHVIDNPELVARTDIVSSTRGVVATRAAGVNSPTVNLTAPAAGDVVGDTMDVRWEASDPDGDALAHLIRYSTDGGTTWTALAADITGSHLPVDMRTMPGGTDVFVEVITTDGLHSAAARVGPFTVPPRAPQVQIMNQDFAPLDMATPATMPQSSSTALLGYAYDAEDGELTGPSLAWRLTGPVTRSGQGDRLLAHDLPPGAYDVELTASDSAGALSTAHTVLHVMAKAVPAGTGPSLDGSCRDGTYTADTDPIRLQYADGDLVEGRMVRAGDELFVCFDGLPDTGVLDYVDLRLDLDNDGGVVMTERDVVIRVLKNGAVEVAAGDGSGGLTTNAFPGSVTPEIGLGSGSWSAELMINGELLGAAGRLIRIRAAHDPDSTAGGAGVWPLGAAADVPGEWGLTAIGAASPVASAAASAVGIEGSPIQLTGMVADPGSGGAVTTSWTATKDTPCTISDPSAKITSVTCADNGIFALTFTVSDGVGSDSAITRVSVTNAPPEIGAVNAPLDPIAVNTPLEVSAGVVDPGTADTVTCTIDWGDGAAPTIGPASAGRCAGSHSYAAAGIYTLSFGVADDDGASDSTTHEYAVVYDPSAGFVTGGGWIDSPPAAYAGDPYATGRATFGFTSRYQRGATTPGGSTRFEFRGAGIEFSSTEYQWLVVSGSRAQFKGIGRLNGAGDHGFLLSVIDGALTSDGVDRFRIKIWDRTTGDVVYDNQPAATDAAAAADAIEGGSIVIHSGH